MEAEPKGSLGWLSMVLPTDATSSRRSWTGRPTRFRGTGSDEYDLYEKDGEFVLSIEMPGFDRDEIEVGWYEGRLTVAAEHEDDRRERSRTYRRTFRMPKEIEDEHIRARYQNGILDVYLPTMEEMATRGTSIPVEG